VRRIQFSLLAVRLSEFNAAVIPWEANNVHIIINNPARVFFDSPGYFMVIRVLHIYSRGVIECTAIGYKRRREFATFCTDENSSAVDTPVILLRYP
jgi:hypothetical protein